MKRKKFEYSLELYGIVLIILAIMAFGPGKPLGYIGRMMRCFAIFLFGTLDWLFLASLFCIGVYMLFKGKAPSFFSTKFIGLLIVTIGILVFAHLDYVVENNNNTSLIFETTINDIMTTFESIKNNMPFTTYGSGIVGCALAVAFNILFDNAGTKIVSIILMVTGTCFFTGFSIIEFIKDGLEKSKNLIPKKHHNELPDEKDSKSKEKESVVIINDNNAPKEEAVEPKLVVSSIDELKRMNNEVKEENKEEVESSTPHIAPAVSNNNYVLPTLSLLKQKTKTKSANSQEQLRII